MSYKKLYPVDPDKVYPDTVQAIKTHSVYISCDYISISNKKEGRYKNMKKQNNQFTYTLKGIQTTDGREIIINTDDIKHSICKDMTGKMESLASISTAIPGGVSRRYAAEIESNKYCEGRINNPDYICANCYADAMNERYPDLKEKLIDNTVLYSFDILPLELLPLLNYALFRLESFADLRTWVQAANYFNICKKNPQVNFALWSKNPWLIQECIDHGYKKPKNLEIVYSSKKMNCVESNIFNLYPFIDKVFTVYTATYALRNNITINCGSRKCLECRVCYTKQKKHMFINEILKSDSTLYYSLVDEFKKDPAAAEQKLIKKLAARLRRQLKDLEKKQAQ